MLKLRIEIAFLTAALSMALSAEPFAEATPVSSAEAVAGTNATSIPNNISAAKPSTVTEGEGLQLPEGYRIGAGDVLQISVFKEPDASVPTALVRSDGKISLPLIKEVVVAGLTPFEAEARLSGLMTRYILGANVTVIVRETHSQKVYLLGGVRAVGPVELKGRTTVLQAITQAGGLSDYAKRKRIYLLRTENGKQVRLPFNYDAVIRGEHQEQNVVVLPDDTIVVPH